MKSSVPPQLCRGLLIALASLSLVPFAVSAQQTVPVTIQVLFGDEVPAGLGGAGGGSLAASTISAAGTTSRLVFQEVVFPELLTLTDKATKSETAARGVLTRPSTLGAIFRYEHIDFDEGGRDLDGNIYSTNAHLAWEAQPFSFGVLLPYDHVALDDVTMNMLGTMLYGRYTLPLAKALSLGVNAHAQYTFTAISDSSDLHTFGTGLGLSLLYDREQFFVDGALLYQYTVDDSAAVNDHQHLLRLGTRAGIRLGSNALITVFGSWIYDATDYQRVVSQSDDNYFDLGTELAFNLSKTWKIGGGYKKVLGLQGFDSDLVFVGTLFRF